ncbi:GNAT family N-acetyltransferase [Mesorhizobium sp. M1050]|uniref:GNAT family N-acetyltransferase n=1 Tax=Mesorhizobium sp. M1050 TaxID=2957051 RepID=UPI00333CD43C
MINEPGFANILSGPVAQPNMPSDPCSIYDWLVRAGVHGFYPNFRPWFFGRVIPGLHSGERHIVTTYVEGALAGVAICKRSEAEHKLCTLWVEPALRERGVAKSLARYAFDWLDSDRPLFTVPEERIAEFAGLLRVWSFSAPRTYPSLYRSNRVEYVFNGSVGISGQ